MIHFYSPITVEPWDFRNLEVGIGGSETSHIELALRLAKRGYEVTSYTDLPQTRVSEHGGVHWRDLAEADFREDGLWIVYRGVNEISSFVPSARRKAYLIIQDTDPHFWQPWKAGRFDRIMGLCPVHVDYLSAKYPEMEDKLCLFGNGISSDRLRKLPDRERNFTRLIFSSSPDRNLSVLLDIFERAQEAVPKLILDVYYGLDNTEKLIARYGQSPYWLETVRTVERAERMFGVTWHGRISQPLLHQEMLGAGIWCYPTNCPETSCITCMEAQALGMTPIVRKYWALESNVRWGFTIDGEPIDSEIMDQWVRVLVGNCRCPPGIETRSEMRSWALEHFDWERRVDEIEKWAVQDHLV